jgi:hypothetical protein
MLQIFIQAGTRKRILVLLGICQSSSMQRARTEEGGRTRGDLKN